MYSKDFYSTRKNPSKLLEDSTYLQWKLKLWNENETSPPWENDNLRYSRLAMEENKYFCSSDFLKKADQRERERGY